jgi:hypothetical protein
MPEAPHEWRPSDLEALRVAFGIPVSPASIRAINDEMARLPNIYPDAIPAAKAHLDAIALIDNPAEPGASTAPEPVIRKVTRKGAVDPPPAQLPQKKLDVIEYATELLMEEVSTEYAIPAEHPSGVSAAVRQRQRHVEALLLILPRLASWMPQPGEQRLRFSGPLIRG